jgi:hypothetical protein
LREAYALIGNSASRDCDWIDSRAQWSETLASHATQVGEALQTTMSILVLLPAADRKGPYLRLS